MLNLLLIGGGEIGAPKVDGTYRPLETLTIDQYFVESLDKQHPNILFIPTATEELDPEHMYEQGIQNLYGKKLGCFVDTLYLSPDITIQNMEDKLDWADGIYIGGGDTKHMMLRWKETGLDKLLKQAALSGKHIAGLSAGAMCWFEKVLVGKGEETTFIDGFGILKNTCMPHWNKHRFFADLPIAQEIPFIAIDECAAIEIVGGDKISIIRSKEKASAFYCRIENGLKERQIHLDDLRKERN